MASLVFLPLPSGRSSLCAWCTGRLAAVGPSGFRNVARHQEATSGCNSRARMMSAFMSRRVVVAVRAGGCPQPGCWGRLILFGTFAKSFLTREKVGMKKLACSLSKTTQFHNRARELCLSRCARPDRTHGKSHHAQHRGPFRYNPATIVAYVHFGAYMRATLPRAGP